jgi:hypothetical protein
MTYVAKDRPRIGRLGAGRMGFRLAGRLERGAAIVDRPDQLAHQHAVFVMVSA